MSDEVRIDAEDDNAIRAATLAVVQTFRELAGPTYAKLGFPLTDVDAANALVGSLLEGLVARYGQDVARRLAERVISNSTYGGTPPQEGPVFVNLASGRSRSAG